MTVSEDNPTFICRYETVSRNQQYMWYESDTYKQAEIWLILNESKYLQSLKTLKNITDDIQDKRS